MIEIIITALTDSGATYVFIHQCESEVFSLFYILVTTMKYKVATIAVPIYTYTSLALLPGILRQHLATHGVVLPIEEL